MKKLLAFLLVLLFALGAVACGESDGTDTTGTETETEAEITIPPLVNTDSDAVTDPVKTETASKSEKETEERVMTEHKLAALTDQKNNCIVVLDLGAEDPTADSAVVWTWSVASKGDVENAQYSNKRLDDVKLRHCDAWGGDVVGVTSSSGLIALVSYPSGDCLFNVAAVGYGPHSIEILPNGLIAVACSGNGNDDKSDVRLYPAMSKNSTECVKQPLASAHGVCWDPENEVLWALGDKEICAYAVGGTRTSPTLTKLAGMGMKISGGGHDLSPVYGNTDRLWVTYSGGVAQFVKSQNRLALTGFAGEKFLNVKSTKSINSYTDGTAISTVADKNNETASHNTNVLKVFTYTPNGSKWKQTTYQYEFEDRDFYKVRAFVPDYQ